LKSKEFLSDKIARGDYPEIKQITKSVFVFLVLVRMILGNRLPCYFLPELPHDDRWMLDKAQHILKDGWLGPYDHFTLMPAQVGEPSAAHRRTHGPKGVPKKGLIFYGNAASNFVLLRSLKKACIYV
jgi:hypothetical protein